MNEEELQDIGQIMCELVTKVLADTGIPEKLTELEARVSQFEQSNATNTET